MKESHALGIIMVIMLAIFAFTVVTFKPHCEVKYHLVIAGKHPDGTQQVFMEGFPYYGEVECTK